MPKNGNEEKSEKRKWSTMIDTFDNYQHWLLLLTLLYILARCSIWLLFRYVFRRVPILISYGGIRRVVDKFIFSRTKTIAYTALPIFYDLPNVPQRVT